MTRNSSSNGVSSGKRIRYEKVAPGIGPVDRDEIMKGYEFEKGEYVLLDQDEIDALAPRRGQSSDSGVGDRVAACRTGGEMQ